MSIQVRTTSFNALALVIFLLACVAAFLLALAEAFKWSSTTSVSLGWLAIVFLVVAVTTLPFVRA